MKWNVTDAKRKERLKTKMEAVINGPLIVLMKYLHGHNLHNLCVVINLSKGLLSLFVLVERKGREVLFFCFLWHLFKYCIFSFNNPFIFLSVHMLEHYGFVCSLYATCDISQASFIPFFLHRWKALSKVHNDVLKNEDEGWTHSYCIEETVVNCLVNNVCNSAGGLMEDNEAIL